jgi:hypothetical protein
MFPSVIFESCALLWQSSPLNTVQKVQNETKVSFSNFNLVKTLMLRRNIVNQSRNMVLYGDA